MASDNRCGRFLAIRLIFALASALCLAAPATAQTTIPGGFINSDTTLALADSPFIVTGSLVVDAGATLTIEPGVVLKFDAAKAITISGTLIARGTAASPITFTASNVANPRGYLHFTDTSADAVFDIDENYLSGSILEYAIVEFAGGAAISDNGAVRMQAAAPFIRNNTIRDNVSRGLIAWELGSGTLRIEGNAIGGNNISISDWQGNANGGGIYVYMSGGAVTISSNTISGNTITNTGSFEGRYGASVNGGGVYAIGGTVAISSNTIRGNSATASDYYQYGDTCGGGVYVLNATVTGNTISANTAHGVTGRGGGCVAQVRMYPAT